MKMATVGLKDLVEMVLSLRLILEILVEIFLLLVLRRRLQQAEVVVAQANQFLLQELYVMGRQWK